MNTCGSTPFFWGGLLSALFTVSSTAEETSWLTGVWGNAAGCAYHRGGSRDADDTLVVLRPDGLETYVSDCEFLSVLRGSGASVVTALCGHEGEELLTAETYIVRDPWEPEARMKRITDGDGNLRDEVAPCD